MKSTLNLYLLIDHLSTEYDLDYFVAIHKTRTQYPDMIEIIIDRPLGELKQRLNEVEGKLALLEREIRGLLQQFTSVAKRAFATPQRAPVSAHQTGCSQLFG